MLGETPAELGAIEASEVATEVIHQVALVQSKYWKSIDLKACGPPEGTAVKGHHVGGFADMQSPLLQTSPPSSLYQVGTPKGEKVELTVDLLKIHRAHHMFTKHNLFQIPLASEELEEAFGGQVVCK